MARVLGLSPEFWDCGCSAKCNINKRYQQKEHQTCERGKIEFDSVDLHCVYHGRTETGTEQRDRRGGEQKGQLRGRRSSRHRLSTTLAAKRAGTRHLSP